MKSLIFLWDEILHECLVGNNSQAPGQVNLTETETMMEIVQLLSRQYRLGILLKPHRYSMTWLKSFLEKQGLSNYFEQNTFRLIDNNEIYDVIDYSKAAEWMGCSPSDMGLVSGSFREGIVDANQAGLKTVWLNPSGAIAPGHIPIQNVEVVGLEALPGALMEQGALPGIQTCQAWYQKEVFSVLLWMHVQMVAVTAYQLAVWLRAAGEMVDPLLTHRGALLHDLGKLSAHQPIENGESVNHGELAALRLEQYGQPILAEIARRHMLFCVLNSETNPETWEQTLVYFADKLVEGAEIKGYVVRLTALQARYPGIETRLAETSAYIEAMQSKICQILECSSEGLIDQLKDAIRG